VSHDPESDIPEAERITDVNDQASEIEQRSLAYYLHTARLKSKRQQEPNQAGVYDLTDCEVCGSEIGAQRLQVSILNLLCIECATALERRQKR